MKILLKLKNASVRIAQWLDVIVMKKSTMRQAARINNHVRINSNSYCYYSICNVRQKNGGDVMYETREIFGVVYHRNNASEKFKPKKDANGNVVKVVKR